LREAGQEVAMTNTTDAVNTVVKHRRGWAMPRSRGGVSGVGLVLLGAWGAVIPFVGPYFDYAYTPDTTWTWTAARFYLQVLPGAITFLAGVAIIGSAHRVLAATASWLAAAGGAWFVVGPLVAPLWRAGYLGTPVGDTTNVSVEQIGMFYALGAAIMLLAGIAVARFSLIGLADAAAYFDRRSVVSAAAASADPSAALTTDPTSAEPMPGQSGQPRHGWVRRGHRPVAH
jgi:hypothetical protein